MKILFTILLLSIGVSLPAYSQNTTGARQSGVLQDLLGNGPGELVISGNIYKYDTESTVFTLRGNPITDGDLAIGMVVRFTMRDGILQVVEVLGPNNVIEDMAEQGVLD